jgi:AraC-like DNA-binding protein
MDQIYSTLHWLLISQCLLLAAVALWRRSPWPLPVILVCLAGQAIWDLASEAGAAPRLDPTPLVALSYGPLTLAMVGMIAWRGRLRLSPFHILLPVAVFATVAAWPQAKEVLYPLIPLSLGAYLLAGILETRRYDRVLRATHSAFESRSLGWLGQILAGLFIIGVVDVARQAASALAPMAEPVLAVATYGAALALVYVLIWRMLTRPGDFDGLDEGDRQLSEGAEAVVEGETVADTSGLEDSLARLDAHMAANRPHLSPDLTIARLAAELGWPSRRLSNVLNRAAGRTFNDYVNAWRVAEAQRMMADPAYEGAKLIAIQLDAGFASKSVFNAAFRREKGLAPGPYRSALSGR